MRVEDAHRSYVEYLNYRCQLGMLKPVSLKASLELGSLVLSCLDGSVQLEDLQPQDFRRILSTASERWGNARLRRLKHWLSGWLKWLSDEGLVSSMPITGRLEVPVYRPQPKQLITADQVRRLWKTEHPVLRACLALGLYAGANPSDLANANASDISGSFFIQPRTKTGQARRAHLPLMARRAALQALPLTSSQGRMSNRRISSLWRDHTRRIFGKSFPFTSCRTTLRTICSGIADEVLETSVMGHTPASASVSLGRSANLKHYLNTSGVDDDVLRQISRKMSEYLQT